MAAAAPRPWPAVGDGLLVLLSAAVHPRCAVGGRFPGRAGHGRADGGGRCLVGAGPALWAPRPPRRPRGGCGGPGPPGIWGRPPRRGRRPPPGVIGGWGGSRAAWPGPA